MSAHVIRRLKLPHCARGAGACKKCQDAPVALSLLDVAPPRAREQARPVIGVVFEGKRIWLPFDVVKTFATEDEARAYAREHGIDDVELGEEE